MKDLVAKINAKFETFKTESESFIEKGVKKCKNIRPYGGYLF
jgi:hypothetical protein